MNGFWGGQSEKCFVDVRVFNLYAASNKCSSVSAAYKKRKNNKRHAYGQCICEVEQASDFYPLLEDWLLMTLSFTSHLVGKQLLWVGFVAIFHFPCCALLLPVSVVLGHHLVTLTEFHPNASGMGGVSFKGLIYSLSIVFCVLLCSFAIDNVPNTVFKKPSS